MLLALINLTSFASPPRKRRYQLTRFPSDFCFGPSCSSLYAESHDRVDNVVVVLLECLDCLLPADAGLGHDELNVLGLETRVVDLLAVILLLLLCLLLLDGLALVAVVVAGVVVASVVAGSLLLGESLGRRGLGLRVEVLNLGLTEDAAESTSVPCANKSKPGTAQPLTCRCCWMGTCRRQAG